MSIRPSSFGVTVDGASLDNQGYIYASGTTAVGVSGYRANITNSGTISGSRLGVRLQMASTLTNSGTIMDGGGSIFEAGVIAYGSGSINNSGVIIGNAGLILNSSGTYSSQIINTGVIYGQAGVENAATIGVPASYFANDTGTFINYGTILGGNNVAAVDVGTGNKVTLSGLVSVSSHYAVDLLGTNELTLLHGVTIDGAIFFGGNSSITLSGSVGDAADAVTLVNDLGLSNNSISIAIDDSASWVLNVEGTVLPAITGFGAADTLVLDGVSYTAANYIPGTGLVLGPETIGISGSFTTEDFTVTSDGTNTTITTDLAAPCFCPGTRIHTPSGAVAVEHLRVGDLVETAYHGPQPIKWIGRRAYEGRFIAGNHLALPIRIRRHALDFNVPSRDLFVSPDHALAEGGVLVHAWRFVNGVSVTQAESVERVEYFHIELENHAVIFAEDLPVESFLDNGTRARFQNVLETDEDFVMQEACLQRVEDGYYLARLKERIDTRAGIAPTKVTGALRGCIDEAGTRLRGWAQDAAAPEAPVELELLCGGMPVTRFLANRYRADLRAAGLGSGCHAFEMMMPLLDGPFMLRRAQDSALLGELQAQEA